MSEILFNQRNLLALFCDQIEIKISAISIYKRNIEVWETLMLCLNWVHLEKKETLIFP